MSYRNALSQAGSALLIAAIPQGVSAADWYNGGEGDTGRDDYVVAIDPGATVTSNSSAFGVVVATIAPVTPLDVSGPRIRVQGLAGVYS